VLGLVLASNSLQKSTSASATLLPSAGQIEVLAKVTEVDLRGCQYSRQVSMPAHKQHTTNAQLSQTQQTPASLSTLGFHLVVGM
jgi:hypothetical protein